MSENYNAKLRYVKEFLLKRYNNIEKLLTELKDNNDDIENLVMKYGDNLITEAIQSDLTLKTKNDNINKLYDDLLN